MVEIFTLKKDYNFKKKNKKFENSFVLRQKQKCIVKKKHLLNSSFLQCHVSFLDNQWFKIKANNSSS